MLKYFDGTNFAVHSFCNSKLWNKYWMYFQPFFIKAKTFVRFLLVSKKKKKNRYNLEWSEPSKSRRHLQYFNLPLSNQSGLFSIFSFPHVWNSLPTFFFAFFCKANHIHSVLLQYCPQPSFQCFKLLYNITTYTYSILEVKTNVGVSNHNGFQTLDNQNCLLVPPVTGRWSL